ncbi:MAG: hypothetical protein KJO42_03030 [Silicimonas sp.]|nr:hypothetical protein [Silicimonas sp.]NNF91664.1 hypothetical protein [Boseongicola sp.]RZW00638.1 MAG: hypothetical protein EX266_13770 [Paracoccaceae bacterium]NND18241.1 hypothetical protein [Silicimonas sp.]NND20479.1 hypothetical protein [Silicimonas sp.]
MRNAAAALGLIGGLLALLMGMVSFGYTEALYRWGEVPDLAEMPENVDVVRAMSVIAPLLAIAGAAMAKYRALWGGLALAAAAAGLYLAFGLGFFSIFPVSMCALAAILALAAGRPDEPKRHF